MPVKIEFDGNSLTIHHEGDVPLNRPSVSFKLPCENASAWVIAFLNSSDNGVHPLHLRSSCDCLIYFQLFFHRDSGCLSEHGNLSLKDKKVLSLRSAKGSKKQE